jgi:2'-5' RNA ligase
MPAEPRTAQPGDICILLEPGADDLPHLRRLQADLQAVYGGRPHDPVHLTCQRFDDPGSQVSRVIQELRQRLTGLPPIPIRAAAVKTVDHSFWRTRLLRWKIEVTDDLRRLLAQIEAGLQAAGVQPHYPLGQGWVPTLVTALEDVDGAVHLPGPNPAPQFLFTARTASVSQITGWREFNVLERIPLRGHPADQ